jgi:hypothetical protein
MHTVEVLEQALDLASRLGYSVRQEWLSGSGGGGCELKGRKLFFLDLDLAADEQLERLLETLRGEPDAATISMPHELRERFVGRRTA